jgi:hypothetical protein
MILGQIDHFGSDNARLHLHLLGGEQEKGKERKEKGKKKKQKGEKKRREKKLKKRIYGPTKRNTLGHSIPVYISIHSFDSTLTGNAYCNLSNEFFSNKNI